VVLLANSAFILAINPALPVRSVTDLIALAKSKPGTLNYASAGIGSSLHMTAELFKYATGTDIVHVAYKGGAPAITDLIAGQTQLIFSTMAPALPHVKSGKLYALGTTGATRAAAAPDVPTIAEAGVKGFEVQNWQGIVVPSNAALPRDV
jgi:tripartite-type tricarboxylate transporter receptor subunit TctC